MVPIIHTTCGGQTAWYLRDEGKEGDIFSAKVCDERGERNRIAAGFPNGDRHEFYCADDIRALKE